MYRKSLTRFYLSLSALVLVSLALAACGNTTELNVSVPALTAVATATSVATTTPPVTSTTTIATTASATKTPATTTPAITTVASTPGATAANYLPATMPGLTEVTLDPAFKAQVVKQVPRQVDADKLIVRYFVSNDDSDTAINNAHQTMTGAGYALNMLGETKPKRQGESVAGWYSRARSADVILGASPLYDGALDASKISGMSPEAAQKLVDQIKGKKTQVLLLSAPNLIQTYLAGRPTPTP